MYVNEIYATEINNTLIRIYLRHVSIQIGVRNNTFPLMGFVVMLSKCWDNEENLCCHVHDGNK